MKQLYESAIAICTIGLAILLFYVAYFCCKRYATDSESVDIEDYIANQSRTIFKEWVFLVIHSHSKNNNISIWYNAVNNEFFHLKTFLIEIVVKFIFRIENFNRNAFNCPLLWRLQNLMFGCQKTYWKYIWYKGGDSNDVRRWYGVYELFSNRDRRSWPTRWSMWKLWKKCWELCAKYFLR